MATPSRSIAQRLRDVVRGALVGYGHGFPMTAGAATSEGWIPYSWNWNFWQEGKNPLQGECNAAVEAAVSAYAQTVAMLPGTVWRKRDDGGRDELPSHPLAQILFQPNDYQTRSDFLMNQVRALLFRGNAYALAVRNERGAITSLHPVGPQHVAVYVEPESQEVFYSIAPTDLTPDQDTWPYDVERMVPAMYVWHVRMNTPFHPLVGVTPLTAAALAIAANCGIQSQQMAFFNNMSRPSGTLNTDMVLTKAQVDELRQRWAEQSTGLATGGVPILTAGLKWTPLSMTAADAQLIDYYKLSIADIARALRVPLPLVGVMDQATFNNTEVLMQFWIASGLGWMLEHIELSLDQFFGLEQDEYCELDTSALLRSNFKERIEGLVRGVQGGVYAPNEARRAEGLPSVEDGDEPRVQQQLVPLSYTGQPLAAPATTTPPANDDDEAPEGAPPQGERAAMVEALEAHGRTILQLRTNVAVLEERTRHAGESHAHAMAMVTATVANAAERFDKLCERVTNRLATLRDGEPGERGPPGEAADIAAILETLRAEMAATLSDVEESVRAEIAQALDAHVASLTSEAEEWHARLNESADAFDKLAADMEARLATVKDGDPGAPGADADNEAITATLRAELVNAVEAATTVIADAGAEAVAEFTALCEQVRARMAEVKDGAPGEPGAAGTVMETWRGDYDPADIYHVHDMVRDEAGAVWIAQALTHAVPGSSDDWQLFIPSPVHGTGFRFLGEWRPGMEVRDGDVVRGPLGAAWIWQGAAGVSFELPGEQWALMVKQGDKGERGKRGDVGPAGCGIERIDAGLGCLVFSMTDGRVLTVPVGDDFT